MTIPIRDIYNNFAIVSKNGRALEFIPEEEKDYKICLAAVKQTGYALKFVPKELQSEELCLAAIKETGYALQYVLKKFQTAKLCAIACKKSKYSNSFQYIKRELLNSEDFCIDLINEYPEIFKFFYKKIKTPKVSLIAVKKNFLNFLSIKQSKQTLEMIEYVFDNSRDKILMKHINKDIASDHIKYYLEINNIK